MTLVRGGGSRWDWSGKMVEDTGIFGPGDDGWLQQAGPASWQGHAAGGAERPLGWLGGWRAGECVSGKGAGSDWLSVDQASGYDGGVGLSGQRLQVEA